MPIYWGDLHGHSNRSDGRDSPENYYAYARDKARLDFCALTDHIDHVPASRLGLMTDEAWEHIRQVTRGFHQPGAFATLLGFECAVPSWDGRTPGNLCVYFKTDDRPLPRRDRPLRDWLRPGAINPQAEMRRLWGALEGADCLRAVVHPASRRQGYTWPQAPREYAVDLIEVYSKRGSCEAPAAPFPVADGAGPGPRPGGTVQDALAAGFRPGFIACSATHFGTPGGHVWENDWGNAARYDQSGLTAVRADELSREAVFDALKNRRCYATTGERIELDFTIGPHPMGSVFTAAGPLRLHVRAVGTRPIKRFEIFKNGRITHHKIGAREQLEMLLDEPPPAEPTWYYVRVTQSGEGCAWSSPIWVLPVPD